MAVSVDMRNIFQGNASFTTVQIYFFCCKVHIRTWKCGTVSCNCGVAVQEGDEIIVIDMCRDGVPRVRFASPVEPRTTVKRDANGRIFVVCN